MIEEEIRITGNTEQAKKSFEELSAVILEQKKITIGFEDDLVRLERKLIAAGNAEWNPSRDLIKKKIIGRV